MKLGSDVQGGQDSPDGFRCAPDIWDGDSCCGVALRHDELGEVQSIAISRDNPQLVVAAEYDSTQLSVFSSTGSFLYTVTGVTCVGDVTFGPDNSLWIAEWEANHFGEITRIPKLFHQLPPPLSYLCEVSILPHLNELPVSLGVHLVMKVLSHSSYVVLQPDPQQSFTKLICTAVCGFPLAAGSSSSMFLVLKAQSPTHP